jgi:hypothetical protein
MEIVAHARRVQGSGTVVRVRQVLALEIAAHARQVPVLVTGRVRQVGLATGRVRQVVQVRVRPASASTARPPRLRSR